MAFQQQVAQVGVDLEHARFQLAIGQGQAAADLVDGDHVLAEPGHAEVVHRDRVGLEGQRHFQRRQHVGPARQLEGLLAGRAQLQGHIVQLQRIQAQLAAQQRADVRVQIGLFRVQVQAVVAEVQVVQGQRAGQRAVDFRPGQAGTGRQAGDDLGHQHIAAGNGLQQPVTGNEHEQQQRGDTHAGADGGLAQAGAAAGLQFGQALGTLFGGHFRDRLGLAHRSAPMLR